MDDSASPEPAALKKILHRQIVLVGVCPEIAGKPAAKVNAGLADAVSAPVRSQSVDCPVRLVIQPMSVVDDVICRVNARNETECGDYLCPGICDSVRILDDIAMLLPDFFPDEAFLRVRSVPLVAVAVLSHVFLCVFEDFHDSRHVSGLCFSDCHVSIIFNTKLRKNHVFLGLPVRKPILYVSFVLQFLFRNERL